MDGNSNGRDTYRFGAIHPLDVTEQREKISIDLTWYDSESVSVCVPVYLSVSVVYGWQREA